MNTATRLPLQKLDIPGKYGLRNWNCTAYLFYENIHNDSRVADYFNPNHGEKDPSGLCTECAIQLKYLIREIPIRKLSRLSFI